MTSNPEFSAQCTINGSETCGQRTSRTWPIYVLDEADSCLHGIQDPLSVDGAPLDSLALYHYRPFITLFAINPHKLQYLMPFIYFNLCEECVVRFPMTIGSDTIIGWAKECTMAGRQSELIKVHLIGELMDV